MKGAYFNKRLRKWCAQISVKSRKLYLGSFDTDIEAHQAYLKAEAKYADIRVGRVKKERWYLA